MEAIKGMSLKDVSRTVFQLTVSLWVCFAETKQCMCVNYCINTVEGWKKVVARAIDTNPLVLQIL